MIDDYLYFGYLPRSGVSLDWLPPSPLRTSIATRLTEQVATEAFTRLQAAVDEALATCPAGKVHVVPLSGGLDSRMILGCLLRRLTTSEIQTFTFGTPGTYDFEIGRHIARTLGLQSTLYSLADGWKWTEQDLVDCAKTVASPAPIFDVIINREVTQVFGSTATYWSGFMGDSITGAHLPKHWYKSWADAKRLFSESQRYSRSISLARPGYEAVDALPRNPLAPGGDVPFYQQLDLSLRQPILVRQIVVNPAVDYKVPFSSPRLVAFFLGVHARLLKRQQLYRAALAKGLPSLASIPSKSTCGLPPTASRARLELQLATIKIQLLSQRLIGLGRLKMFANYLDYSEKIREAGPLRELVASQVLDLERRQVVTWIDLRGLLSGHLRQEFDVADALMLLVSMECYLKANHPLMFSLPRTSA